MKGIHSGVMALLGGRLSGLKDFLGFQWYILAWITPEDR
jgi:hypothetical protein